MRLEIDMRLTPPKRNRHEKKPHSGYVACIIAKHYDKLKNEFNRCKDGNFCSMSFEDIFQESILYVIQDPIAFNMSESEIIEHFRYRYKMIKYQITQDSKLIHYSNANNIQAPEEA